MIYEIGYCQTILSDRKTYKYKNVQIFKKS